MKKTKLFFLLPLLSVFMLTSCLNGDEITPETPESQNFSNFITLNRNAENFISIAKSYVDIYSEGKMRVEMEVLAEDKDLGTATLKISFDKLEMPGDFVQGAMFVMLSKEAGYEKIEVRLDNVVPSKLSSAYYNGTVSRSLVNETDNQRDYEYMLQGFLFNNGGYEFSLNYSYSYKEEGFKTTDRMDDKATWANGFGTGYFGDLGFSVDMLESYVASNALGGVSQGKYSFRSSAVNLNFTAQYGKYGVNKLTITTSEGKEYTY